jgi:hypothetical protein
MDSLSSRPSDRPSPSEIRDILRQKRKHQPQRACHPCRLRKVKCSYTLPCEKCVERDHPNLCSYDQPSKRSNTITSLVGDQVDEAETVNDDWKPSKSEWTLLSDELGIVSESLLSIQHQLQHLTGLKSLQVNGAQDSLPERSDYIENDPQAGLSYDVHGVAANHMMTGEEVYLGSKSVPAMVMALSNDDSNDTKMQELLSKSILPIFALDNESTTYPFADLWGVPHGTIHRLELLCSVLPSNADCNQIFRQYRDTAYVIYPALADIQQFEGSLVEFLAQRRNGVIFEPEARLTDRIVFGESVNWLGLLFAVFASGLQCSDLPRKEMVAKSQVYGVLRLLKGLPNADSCEFAVPMSAYES